MGGEEYTESSRNPGTERGRRDERCEREEWSRDCAWPEERVGYSGAAIDGRWPWRGGGGLAGMERGDDDKGRAQHHRRGGMESRPVRSKGVQYEQAKKCVGFMGDGYVQYMP